MTNPFEDDATAYVVLTNTENQHSLWPATADVPKGWTVRHEGSRQSCLDYVETHWTDLRPASLASRMGKPA
ncbi:MbtH family protein [Streptomyces sp. NPDC048566]|uniref:MbtH family protein n=1 Tax=unclassified Streptomyces TaxID=2593676 RepID=UPI000950AD57|nr:MbtH family NRPS accessory protein [Streptomyces sp. TN58]APU42985.1 MbtH family protein [Streptomyces sp. TN58]